MSYQKVELAIDKLLGLFSFQEPERRFLIAFSGGMDSTVLLHALSNHAEIPNDKLLAVHINHGLQSQAEVFQAFCEVTCQNWQIPFEVKQVEVKDTARKGVEAAARAKRYAALMEGAGQETVLLTAHHQRDQTETVLLSLARGAGLSGLAAMPMVKTIQMSTLAGEDYANQSLLHCRPLLEVPYDAMQAYAKHYQLDWVEDPTNQDIELKRNYIRHEILPKMHQAWSFFNENTAKSAHLLAESLSLQNELAELDLAKCQHNGFRLDLSPLVKLSWARQKNVIRFWMNQLPNRFALNGKMYDWLQDALRYPSPDRYPALKLAEKAFLKVYENKVFYYVDFQETYQVDFEQFQAEALGFEESDLMAYKVAMPWLQAPHHVMMRNVQSDDFQDTDEAKRFKKWLKQHGVVAWNRPRWPVLEVDGEVAAILGFRTSRQFSVPPSSHPSVS